MVSNSEDESIDEVSLRIWMATATPAWYAKPEQMTSASLALSFSFSGEINVALP